MVQVQGEGLDAASVYACSYDLTQSGVIDLSLTLRPTAFPGSSAGSGRTRGLSGRL